MVDAEIRSALGTESSEWKKSGECMVVLHNLHSLGKAGRDVVDNNKEFEWIGKQLYNVVFRYEGWSVLDNRRRCMWYFGREVGSILWQHETSCPQFLISFQRPPRNHDIPATFDIIRIIPHRHYVCFYDTSSPRRKSKFISKLDILKPEDRQLFFDIRYAPPNRRQRLLKWDRKIRSERKSLLRQTLEKSLPATFIAGKAIEDSQSTGIVKEGTVDDEHGKEVDD